jgi:hypothetical protein
MWFEDLGRVMFPQFSILGRFEISLLQTTEIQTWNHKVFLIWLSFVVDGWLGGGFKHLHMWNERFYVKIIDMVSSIGYPMIQILGTCNQMQSLPIGASTSSFCYIKQGVCHTVALPFTLKSILRQKKNYQNSNISPCKNVPNLQKIL